MKPTWRSIRLGDSSQVGEARRAGIALAGAAGFSEEDSGRVAIAVTEAASNMIKHAGGGEILLRLMEAGVEMLAIDKGPGFTDLERAIEDGYSTAGTNGIGLGAIARLASAVDVYTGTKLGTAMVARFYPSGPGDTQATPGTSVVEVGVAQAPYPGEHACGDVWGSAGGCVFLADGLGHGPQAAAAAEAAVAAFEENCQLAEREAVEAIHCGLRGTRGAAIALASLDFTSRRVRYCGVGNISGVIVTGPVSRSMVSHNGTAGHDVYRIAPFEYDLPPGSLVILHTDGLSAKWDLQAYPGLEKRDPSLIAGVLYRDFRRQRDDATVLVVKEVDRHGKAGVR